MSRYTHRARRFAQRRLLVSQEKSVSDRLQRSSPYTIYFTSYPIHRSTRRYQITLFKICSNFSIFGRETRHDCQYLSDARPSTRRRLPGLRLLPPRSKAIDRGLECVWRRLAGSPVVFHGLGRLPTGLSISSRRGLARLEPERESHGQTSGSKNGRGGD